MALWVPVGPAACAGGTGAAWLVGGWIADESSAAGHAEYHPAHQPGSEQEQSGQRRVRGAAPPAVAAKGGAGARWQSHRIKTAGGDCPPGARANTTSCQEGTQAPKSDLFDPGRKCSAPNFTQKRSPSVWRPS